jgi:metal-responsive CopG/Arc/MetJ family transcriptional regulator
MTSVKTAISLDQGLFEQGEHLAQQLRVSRSELYARALADFVKRHRAQSVTEALNAIYDEEPAPSEASAIKRHLRNVLANEGRA